MNNNNSVILKTLKEMQSSFFIIPLVIMFLGLSDLFLFESYGFASFTYRYINLLFYNIELGEGIIYFISIILFYLLSIALLYAIIIIYIIKKRKGLNTDIGEIFSSLKNTYFHTLFTYIYIIVSFGLIMQIIRLMLLSLGERINPFVGITLSETIGYYIFSVIVFAVAYSIDKGISIKQLTLNVLKYVLSKSTLVLLLFLLISSGIYSVIQKKITDFVYNSMMNSSSIFSSINEFSMSNMPIWYYCIDWFFKGVIISFILIYVCMIYVNKEKKLVSN